MLGLTVSSVIDFVTIVFVLSTMGSMGLELGGNEILASLRQRRLMAKSLLVNLVLIPLLAFVLVLAIPMKTEHTIGLLLVAIAPGAPFGPKIAEISRSDIAFASGLMAVLAVVSIITIPITVAIFMPSDITTNPLGIARIVVVAQLVPMFAGLGLKVYHQPIAARLLPPARQLSTYSLVALVGVLLFTNFGEFLRLAGDGPLFVSAIVVGGALLLGYVFGGSKRSTREVLATTTAMRNVAIALLIATTNFPDSDVLTMVVSFGMISVIISGPIAGQWRRRIDE